MGEALSRLERLIGAAGPDWGELERFLPEGLAPDPVERRAAIASTLIAGLELAKHGGLELRQEAAFGPILLRAARMSEEDTADAA